jgi:hypothetical protein
MMQKNNVLRSAVGRLPLTARPFYTTTRFPVVLTSWQILHERRVRHFRDDSVAIVGVLVYLNAIGKDLLAAIGVSYKVRVPLEQYVIDAQERLRLLDTGHFLWETGVSLTLSPTKRKSQYWRS